MKLTLLPEALTEARRALEPILREAAIVMMVAGVVVVKRLAGNWRNKLFIPPKE